MPKAKSFRAYVKLSSQAVHAFHRGDYRVSADKYREAILVSPNVWAENRYHIFSGYTSILREKYFIPNETDLKFLKKIKKNEKEPIIYRCESAFTLGLLRWDQRDREEAAEYYRQAIALGNQATPQERQRVMMATKILPNGNPSVGLRSVGEVTEEIVKQVRENLETLERPKGPTPFPFPLPPRQQKTFKRSDGSEAPLESIRFGVPFTDPTIGDRLAVGGKNCDCCKKSCEEVGMTTLLVCSRCKLAYYCSSECQKRQWKAGHKQACRKKGQIEPEDHMKIEGLEKTPEFNGLVVKVVGPDTKKAGRWEVCASKKSFSVAGEKLVHIRPVI